MKKNDLVKYLMLISQVSFSMLAPIILTVAAGVFLNNRFDKPYIVPIALFLGMAASFRNTWLLLKSYMGKKSEEEKNNDRINELLQEGERKRRAALQEEAKRQKEGKSLEQ